MSSKMMNRISFRYQIFAIFSISFQTLLPLLNIFAPVQALDEVQSETVEIVETSSEILPDELLEESGAVEESELGLLLDEPVVPSEEAAEVAEPAIIDEAPAVQEEIAPLVEETEEISDSGLYVSYIVIGDSYKFRDSLGQDVELVFTKISADNGDLRIKEVLLTKEQQKKLGALNAIAYDITSSMENSSFEYDLKIGLPENDVTQLGLVYVDNLSSVENSKKIDAVNIDSDVLTAENLNHFTVFVVVQNPALDPFPSTNELNKSINAPYVNFVSNTQTSVDLNLVNPTGSDVWFEIKKDEQPASGTNKYGPCRLGVNPLHNSCDGRRYLEENDYSYPSAKVSPGQTRLYTVSNLSSYVSVRMTFGPERDWDFNWTRFDVLPVPNTPPVVTIIDPTPAEGSYVKGAITGRVTATDDTGMGSYYLRFWKDAFESGTANLKGNCQSAPGGNLLGTSQDVTCNFNTALFPDGKYVFSAQFLDKDIAWGKALRSFNVDNTAPTIQNLKYFKNNVEVTTPATTPILVGSIDDLKYSADYTDGGSGLKKTAFVIWDATETWAPVSNSHKCNWNTPPSTTVLDGSNAQSLSDILLKKCNPGYSWPSGKYIITHVVYDNAGNLAYNSGGSQRFIIDKTPPSKPSNLRYFDVVKNSEVACGITTTKRTLHPKWDANSENDFSHYEYTSFDADNSPQGWRIGLNEVVMHSNEFVHNWVPPVDGMYGFAVRSVDLAGNKSEWSIGGEKTLEDSCYYSVDSVAPAAPQISFPNPEQYFNTAPILNDWNDVADVSGISHYRVEYAYDDNHAFANMPYRQTTESQRNHVPGLSEQGGVKLRVQAFDNAGNEGAWSEWRHYYYDSTAPAKPTWGTVYKGHDIAVATEVQCGGITNNTEIILQWNANTETDLAGYWFGTKFNQKHQWITAGTNLKTANMTPGNNPYYYTVIAVDLAGNESEKSDQCGLTLDQESPAAPLLVSPANGAFVKGANITQSWSTSDSDIAYYMYESFHDEAATEVRWNENFTTTSKTATNVGDAVYWWRVSAVDHAGNIGPSSEIWKITVDNTAPTSTITPPEDTVQTAENTVILNNWDGSIAGTSQDNLSGVKQVWISIQMDDDKFWDGDSWETGLEKDIRIPITTSNLWNYVISSAPGAGVYKIRSHAEDNAGNLENTATLIIIYDKTIPEVGLAINPTTADGQRSWYKTEPTITLTATDLNNISKIEYQWNGTSGEWTTYTAPVAAPQGNNQFYYRAIDMATNLSEIGTKTVLFDKESPVNPETMAIKRDGNKAVVSWTEAKDNAGIHGYEIVLQHLSKDIRKSVFVAQEVREVTFDNLEDGQWKVSIASEDFAGWKVSMSQEMTVGGGTGDVAGVSTEEVPSKETQGRGLLPYLTNAVGDILGMTDKKSDEDEAATVGGVQQAAASDGLEGQVAGAETQCETWQYYLPVILLGAQLLFLIFVIFMMNIALLPKAILSAVITIIAIAVSYYFQDGSCYTPDSFLGMLNYWFMPLSVLISLGALTVGAIFSREN